MAKKYTPPLTGLAGARNALGVNQAELAVMLGVSRTTVSNWENSSERQPWLSLVCQGLYASRIIPSISEPMTGADLAAARSLFGLDQEAFGRKLGVSRTTISRWENDTPPLWLSYAIATLAFTIL